MGQWHTKGDEDADVAHALVRAAFPLMGTPRNPSKTCSHECEHGTLGSVRHVGVFNGALPRNLLERSRAVAAR